MKAEKVGRDSRKLPRKRSVTRYLDANPRIGKISSARGRFESSRRFVKTRHCARLHKTRRCDNRGPNRSSGGRGDDRPVLEEIRGERKIMIDRFFTTP